MTEYYFLYCRTHDDGMIVESANNVKNHSCNSNITCTFEYNGLVKFDGKNIREINKVRRDYDRYGGGFKFEFYKDCTNDELLKNWIQNQN